MTITIYSTSICAACRSLEQWLDKQDIKYQIKITDSDPAIMAEFMSINDGLIGVPFTVIDSGSGQATKISGFDIPKFKKALAIS